jgi:phosphatidylglycerol---prolipoprotein diacylglyceryl transferase
VCVFVTLQNSVGGGLYLSPTAIHALFDLAAWISAATLAFAIGRWRPLAFPVAASLRADYVALAMLGAATGGYLFGTLNLWVSDMPGLGRSIEGAIFGGVLTIELFKRIAGIIGTTGARFAAPLAIGVAIGRIGCFYSGIEDFTYGVPTNLPWAVNCGDGIMRHPVQLYESATMAAFLAVYLSALAIRSPFWAGNGFYLAVGFYGIQRFFWEFLKPYATVIGPFTIFHLLSIGLAAYGGFMIWTKRGTAHPAQGRRVAASI